MSQERKKVQTTRTVRVMPVNDIFQIDQWLTIDGVDFALTDDLRLFAAVELDGVDPDALDSEAHTSLAKVINTAFAGIDHTVTVSQYQISYDGGKVSIKDRDNAIDHDIAKSRESFLNQKGVSETRIIHFFELDLDDSYSNPNLLNLAKNTLKAFTSKDARKALKNSLSFTEQVVLSRKDLNLKAEKLSTAIKNLISYLESVFAVRILSSYEQKQVLAYLASFTSASLVKADLDLPLRDAGTYLPQGDIEPVRVGQQQLLKFDGANPRYARIASVTRIGSKPAPGFWGRNKRCPARIPGNHVLMFRWRKQSSMASDFMFSSRERELARSQLKVGEMLSNKQVGYEEKKDRLGEAMRQKLEELDRAQALDVAWSDSQSFILVYGETPKEVQDSVRSMHNALENTGAVYVWEGLHLPEAYKAFYPTGKGKSVRAMTTNSAQNAACGLYFKSGEGQRVVSDYDGDEAQFIFETANGRPFYYAPFVHQKGLVMGVGPTRTGKTYLKNTLASHFLKYGGQSIAIDVDPGTETLAKVLGKDGAIFRPFDPDTEGGSGFNLYSSCRSDDDMGFRSHITQQLIRMLKANDEEGAKVLDEGEQEDLDRAITSAWRVPAEHGGKTLSCAVMHMKPRLQQKFKRWVRNFGGQDGMYSSLTDCDTDGAGGMGGRLKVFNLQHIKDDPHMMAVTYPEIFFRLTRMLEDSDRKHLPDQIDIDEAHIPLRDDYFVDELITKIRTVNKYKISISLWTQAVEELKELPKWGAVRSAVATYIFLPNPDMNQDHYIEAFGLTSGECEAIRNCKPKGEAYIIQRDIGVSKVVRLNNDAFVHGVTTSAASEAARRETLINDLGVEGGLKEFAEEIEHSRSGNSGDKLEISNDHDFYAKSLA